VRVEKRRLSCLTPSCNITAIMGTQATHPPTKATKKVVLHAVVGSDLDFLPTATFFPEVHLHLDPLIRTPVDKILPGGQWGGWPFRLQEVLSQRTDGAAHLIVPAVVSSAHEKEDFITRLRHDMVRGRTNLLGLGVEEVRTGALILRRELLPMHRETEELGWESRLETMGFREHLCLADSSGREAPASPFVTIPSPGKSATDAIEWAHGLLEGNHFLVLE
jgi:hypothetical protein